jgi:hypothetical protein
MNKNKIYVLVKYDGGWADEMNVPGFQIFSQDEYDSLLAQLKKHETEVFPYTHYVGTNEKIMYDSVEHLLYDFEVVEISEADYKVIKKVFGSTYFGHFPEPEDNLPIF